MFLVLDGPDGAGKSTQIQRLHDCLEDQGRQVVRIREPGGTPAGERIRDLLLMTDVDLTPLTECFLFNAARSQLVETVVLPALDRGDVVLCDRFWPSTIVYQALAGGVSLEAAQDLCRRAVSRAQPDHILIIDVPVDVTESRLGDARDRMESKGRPFLEAVREGFRDLATRHGWPLLDGTAPVDSVADRIRNVVGV